MAAMHEHAAHDEHAHVHGPGCGHVGIVHEGHIDFLHDGHLHHPHGDHVCEHVIAVDEQHPDRCDGGRAAGALLDPGHVHGPGCGHEPVPHGDHVDYLVDGHLQHPHEGHCDDHGSVALT